MAPNRALSIPLPSISPKARTIERISPPPYRSSPSGRKQMRKRSNSIAIASLVSQSHLFPMSPSSVAGKRFPSAKRTTSPHSTRIQSNPRLKRRNSLLSNVRTPASYSAVPEELTIPESAPEQISSSRPLQEPGTREPSTKARPTTPLLERKSLRYANGDLETISKLPTLHVRHRSKKILKAQVSTPVVPESSESEQHPRKKMGPLKIITTTVFNFFKSRDPQVYHKSYRYDSGIRIDFRFDKGLPFSVIYYSEDDISIIKDDVPVMIRVRTHSLSSALTSFLNLHYTTEVIEELSESTQLYLMNTPSTSQLDISDALVLHELKKNNSHIPSVLESQQTYHRVKTTMSHLADRYMLHIEFRELSPTQPHERLDGTLFFEQERLNFSAKLKHDTFVIKTERNVTVKRKTLCDFEQAIAQIFKSFTKSVSPLTADLCPPESSTMCTMHGTSRSNYFSSHPPFENVSSEEALPSVTCDITSPSAMPEEDSCEHLIRSRFKHFSTLKGVSFDIKRVASNKTALELNVKCEEFFPVPLTLKLTEGLYCAQENQNILFYKFDPEDFVETLDKHICARLGL